jgi:hypothetical protein
MDEAAQDVASSDTVVRGHEAKPSVGSGAVVMLRVGAKDTFEMPPSKHKQPVQAL